MLAKETKEQKYSIVNQDFGYQKGISSDVIEEKKGNHLELGLSVRKKKKCGAELK